MDKNFVYDLTMYNLLLEGRFKKPLKRFKKRSYFFFEWLDSWFFKRTKTFVGLKMRFANLAKDTGGLGLLKNVGKFYYKNKNRKKNTIKIYSAFLNSIFCFILVLVKFLVFSKFLFSIKNKIKKSILKYFFLFKNVLFIFRDKNCFILNRLSLLYKKIRLINLRASTYSKLFYKGNVESLQQVVGYSYSKFLNKKDSKSFDRFKLNFIRFFFLPSIRNLNFELNKKLIYFYLLYNKKNKNILTWCKDFIKLSFHVRKKNYFITTSSFYTGKTFLNSSAGACVSSSVHVNKRIYYSMSIFKKCFYKVWFDTFKKKKLIDLFDNKKKSIFITSLVVFIFRNNIKSRILFFQKFMYNAMRRFQYKNRLGKNVFFRNVEYDLEEKAFMPCSLKKKKRRRI